MLGLPSTTEIDAIFPKESFYSNWALPAKVKREFVDLIARIRAVNTVKQATAHVTEGAEVKEIFVFLFTLKGEEFPQQALATIARSVDRRLVFVVRTVSGRVSTSVFRHGSLHTVPGEEKLDLSPGNLDLIWDGFCSAIIFGAPTAGSVDERIDAADREKQLSKLLADTTRKLDHCRQMRRRNELFTQRGKLTQELESVRAQLGGLEGKTEER